MSYGHHHNRFSPDFAHSKVKLPPGLQLYQMPPNLIPDSFWVRSSEDDIVLGRGDEPLSLAKIEPDEEVGAVIAEAIFACWLWQGVNTKKDFWMEATE